MPKKVIVFSAFCGVLSISMHDMEQLFHPIVQGNRLPYVLSSRRPLVLFLECDYNYF